MLVRRASLPRWRWTSLQLRTGWPSMLMIEVARAQPGARGRRLRVDHADERHERRVRDADAALHRDLAVALCDTIVSRAA